MTNNPIFVLDANVFMEASRHYYAFDLAPKFWDSLILHARDGRIESIDRVKKELERGNDDLAKWAKVSFDFAFISTNEDDVLKSYREIMEWANAQTQFTETAKAVFADEPDGWLIAYAKAKGRVVATQEVSAPLSKKDIKIPDVCRAFNVPFINTFEMLRTFGIRFA